MSESPFIVEVKFQVGKLKTSPAELACCQDLRVKEAWNVWSETWSVDPLHIRQILSTITSLTHSQVVTLDADDSMSKWTDLKQLSIFHGGNGQSESSYFFVCQILSCQASWFQAMATLRFCHSHRPGLYPFLPHRSTTSSVQLTC